MSDPSTEGQNRVLVLAPIGRDASLICQHLARSGITATICKTIDDLKLEISDYVDAVLISEDVLTIATQQVLIEIISQQPSWSDLPLIIFSSSEERMTGLLEGLTSIANLTILERPMHSITLLSAVRSALRARQRQYQTRKLLTELQEANKLKDEFLATVSHELRTPLTAILGWSRMLQSGKLDESTKKRAMETVERNAKAQAQLIEDLLDISRIISGNLRLEIVPVSLTTIIETAIDSIRLASEAKEIQIHTMVELNTGKVLGDPARLQQVVWNLLSNAIKFTPRGGQVKIRLAKVASHVEIEVSDTGKGINADFLPFVFDKFRQADNSLARAQGGLGLGLSIARHIVELHGGVIKVHSSGEDQGTTFTIQLPILATLRTVINEEIPQPKREFKLVCPPELVGKHVLVVDDEPDTREIIAALLDSCNMDVITAASASEALNILARGQTDLLISDIGMPGQDGYELIAQVRALSNKSSLIPAIALTAYARIEDRMKAIKAGFQLHITKPVEPVDLIDGINQLLNQLKEN